MKILIIDDTYANNLLLESILKDEGYEVDYIEDSKKAINFFHISRPDLVILDLIMEIPGLEILIKIREISNIPIIILTCVRSSSIMKRALELGCNDYILKPIGVESFLKVINKFKI